MPRPINQHFSHPQPVRGGFRRGATTIIELVIVIALSVIVLTAVWEMTLLIQRARSAGYHAAGMTVETAEVDADLRADLGQAGTGMPSSWNVGGVAVGVGAVGGLPSDTLTLLLPASGPVAVSATTCTTSAGCIRLRGDQTSRIPVGSLLWVGTPRTGAQLLQVTAATAVQDACGADCSAQEAVLCADSIAGTLTLPVVTQSTRTKAGIITYSASPCPASVFADGTVCDETTTPTVVGNRTAPSCSEQNAGNATYTDLGVADRTSAIGYPAPPASILRSGARGTPAVLAVPVVPVRYTIDRSDASHPRLVRAQGIDVSGAWHVPAPVATDVQSMAVNVQHADTSGLVRGIGVTAANLSPTSGNPNYSYTTTPASIVVPGIAFRRSYRSVALVRVVFTVIEHEASIPQPGSPAVRKTLTTATIVSTPQITSTTLPALTP